MDKENLLRELKALAEAGQVSKEEVMRSVFPAESGRSADFADAGPPANLPSSPVGIAEILYYVGGAVVVIGIAILVGQNWSALPDFTKILVTLGAGLVSYVLGMLFVRDDRTERLAAAFQLIASLLIPLGIFVTLDLSGINVATPGWHVLIFAAMVAVYLFSYLAIRRNLFLLFTIIFGTLLYFALANFMDVRLLFEDFAEYMIMGAGASYLLLGYSFAQDSDDKKKLSGFLYGAGTLGVLGPAIMLGGKQDPLWDLIFIPLVFGALTGSVFLKSRAILAFGTIFLMIYIMKLTAVYFSQGLGWPIALIFAGLGLIGAGYFSVYLRRKYFSASSS